MKISVIITFCLLTACYNTDIEDSQVDTNLLGKKLIFPKEVEIIMTPNCIMDSSFIFSKKYIIVTWVNFGCGVCFKELIELTNILKTIKNKNIGLIIYGASNGNLSGIYYFLQIIPNFEYPIFADTASLFLKTNKIPINDKSYHTFLINHEKTILTIGAPIDSNVLQKHIKIRTK